MKNLLISAFTGYDDVAKVSDIVHSWNAVKKEGDEFIVATHGETNVCHEYLEDRGVKLVFMKKAPKHPYHTRFWWFEHIINTHGQGASNVLCVDIRDVVFQYNPFDWLKFHRNKGLVVCDEGIYHDEEWNGFMLKKAFPKHSKNPETLPVLNCGVIGGSPQSVAKICSRIGKMTDGLPFSTEYDGKEVMLVADQAAYGVMLKDRKEQVVDNRSNWCLTMGMVAASLDVGDTLAVKDGQFLNPKGEAYAVVHQYDRHEVVSYDIAENRFYAVDKQGKTHRNFGFQLSS